MAEKESEGRKKISKDTAYYLDTYGYAELGRRNTSVQIPAMQEMYSAFLGENSDDPIIATTLGEAYMARKHLEDKDKYDNLPEEERKNKKDPGKLDLRLERSLLLTNQATQTYAAKRQEMYLDLTINQALDYNTKKGDFPRIKTPKNISNLFKDINKKVGDLNGDSEKESLIGKTLFTLDDHKIEGELNYTLRKRLAERKLEALSSHLEELAA